MKKYLVLFAAALSIMSCGRNTVPAPTGTLVAPTEAPATKSSGKPQAYTEAWDVTRKNYKMRLKFFVSKDVTFTAWVDSIYSDEYGEAHVDKVQKQYFVSKDKPGTLKEEEANIRWIYFEPEGSEIKLLVPFMPNITPDKQFSLGLLNTATKQVNLKDNIKYIADVLPNLMFIVTQDEDKKKDEAAGTNEFKTK